jgi:hypothetical protein
VFTLLELVGTLEVADSPVAREDEPRVTVDELLVGPAAGEVDRAFGAIGLTLFDDFECCTDGASVVGGVAVFDPFERPNAVGPHQNRLPQLERDPRVALGECDATGVGLGLDGFERLDELRRRRDRPRIDARAVENRPVVEDVVRPLDVQRDGVGGAVDPAVLPDCLLAVGVETGRRLHVVERFEHLRRVVRPEVLGRPVDPRVRRVFSHEVTLDLEFHVVLLDQLDRRVGVLARVPIDQRLQCPLADTAEAVGEGDTPGPLTGSDTR